MIQVEFLHDYSNGKVEYTKGQITELTAEQIAFLERDSPGCLKRIEAPAVDKMVKAPKINKAILEPDEEK
jgi:hypothetical protein